MSAITTESPVEITPARAKAYLEFNTKNRRANADRVAAYARDMLAGQWNITGETIKFAEDGTLLDGQQRLMACIEAGVPFYTFMTHGLKMESQRDMDQGKKRTVSDSLMIDGRQYVTQVAAIGTLLLAVKDKRNHVGARYTISEVRAVIDRHEEAIMNGLHAVTLPNNRTLVPISTLAAIHVVGSKLLGEGDMADAFVDVFNTGIPAYPHDAAFALRERMISQIRKRQRLPRMTQVSTSVMAWNKFRAGTEQKNMMRLYNKFKFDGLDVDLI